MRWLVFFMALGAAGLSAAQPNVSLRDGGGKRWLKGNTHTHTLWSDGDGAPEKVAAWYKAHGYQFLVFTEHNQLQFGERWIPVREDFKVSPERIEELKAQFGENSVVLQTEDDGRLRMRLKTHEELQAMFEEPDKFILLPGEELTSAVVHMNGINLREAIRAARAQIPVEEQVRRNFESIAAQSEQFGVPMVAQLNHPNFSDGVTAEEFAAVKGLHFFEVYNGHAAVRNWGRPSEFKQPTDKLWDIVLTSRICEGEVNPIYGVGTDDSHDYYEQRVGLANSGRGWIMVLSDTLSAEAVVEAMKRGDFYASSGATLEAITANAKEMRVSIAAEDGVTYTTQFIGTREGYDGASEPARDADGNDAGRKTRVYSDDIGEVLFETTENPAVYPIEGDEIYVRAKVISSKTQTNPFAQDDLESAWTQPVQLKTYGAASPETSSGD